MQPQEFSGGEAPGQAKFVLRRLGFDVVAKEKQAEVSPKAWSDAEVQTIVGDYFEMLQKELRGEQYVKAEHNRAIRSWLDARSKSSVEFKHQNISAVLLKLGLPYIDGYKPASNYQGSLAVAVREYLEVHQFDHRKRRGSPGATSKRCDASTTTRKYSWKRSGETGRATSELGLVLGSIQRLVGARKSPSRRGRNLLGRMPVG